MCLLNRFSRVRFFTILSTVGHQNPLSMGFSRQEYWKLGCHGPPPGDLPDPGTETAPLAVPALPVNSLPLSHWGSPIHMNMFFFRFLPLIGYYKILHMVPLLFISVFANGSDSKESACNAGDPGLIHGLRRSSGEGNGNPLQYSCLENSMHREAWWATVHTVAELDTSGYLFRSLEGFFSPFYLSCRIYCTSHLYFLIL